MRFASIGVVVALLFATGTSFAQSAFFPREKNGYFFGASYLTADELDGFSFEGAHAVSGIAAFGVGVDRIGFNEIDLDQTSITPYFSALAVRPGDGGGLGIETVLFYTYATVSGEAVGDNDNEAHGSGLGAGASFFGTLDLGSNVKIHPMLSVAYVGGDIGSSEEEFSKSADVEGSQIGFGLALQFNQEQVILSSASYQDEIWLYSIGLRAAIPSRSEW